MTTLANQDLEEELSAALKACDLSSGSAKHIRLVKSDLPALTPSGSMLKLCKVKLEELKMGDLICVSEGRGVAVRRFVRSRVTRHCTLLLTAREKYDRKEPFPKACLLGRVEAVNAGSGTYDPRGLESLWSRFWGLLTEYGTHRPFGLWWLK